jgi:hypothetical protein
VVAHHSFGRETEGEGEGERIRERERERERIDAESLENKG